MKNIILLTVVLGLSAYANMTPQKYFELDFKVKELSLERQQTHKTCAEQACSAADYYRIDGEYQTRTFDLYGTYATTPAQALLYANRNRADIQQYLNKHEEIQNQIEAYRLQFDAIDAEIKSLKGEH